MNTQTNAPGCFDRAPSEPHWSNPSVSERYISIFQQDVITIDPSRAEEFSVVRASLSKSSRTTIHSKERAVHISHLIGPEDTTTVVFETLPIAMRKQASITRHYQPAQYLVEGGSTVYATTVTRLDVEHLSDHIKDFLVYNKLPAAI